MNKTQKNHLSLTLATNLLCKHALIFFLFLCWPHLHVLAQDEPSSPEAHQNLFKFPSNLSYQWIPVPVYATSPNEGDTFGLLPVILQIDKKASRTLSIFAPSVSFNKTIRWTGTFRWFFYPTTNSSFTFVPSYSSHVNKNLKLEFTYLPQQSNSSTFEFLFYPKRSIFERFFGLGPWTKAEDEGSYTKTGGTLTARYGYNLSPELNVGVKASAERWFSEHTAIDGMPKAKDRFGDVLGMNGATVLGTGLSIRYDERPQREFSEQGWAAEGYSGVFYDASHHHHFGRTEIEAKGIWREWRSWLSGAARGFWSYTPGAISKIPFFDLSQLGGEYRFRGFNGGRFHDRGAWELDFEQRFRLMETHFFDVTTEWRADPFVSIGQVYSGLDNFSSKIRHALGIGFRAWVRPNIVGRIDIASGGEGLKIYVELGYPY